MTIEEVMRTAPVIPVLVLDGSLDPVALADGIILAGPDWRVRTVNPRRFRLTLI